MNAWNSYTYSGLNTVVEGTSTEITINSTTAINDVIGFRVYAVNFDGTLVDPDGKAFYVQLGNAATDWNATATTVTALNPTDKAVTDTQSDKVAVSLTKLTAPTAATWTTDKVNNVNPAFNAILLMLIIMYCTIQLLQIHSRQISARLPKFILFRLLMTGPSMKITNL